MMRQHRGLLILTPLIVLLGTLHVSADPIQVTVNLLTEDPAGQALALTINGATVDAFVGKFNINVTPVNGTTTGPFDAYCIDIYHDVYIPSQWQATVDTTFGGNSGVSSGLPDGSGNVQEIAQLYNQFDALASQSSNPSVYYMGLQIAIWAAEYDGKITDVYNAGSNVGFRYGSSDANFNASDSVYVQANYFLNNVDLTDPNPGTFFTTIQNSVGSTGAQDLITGGPNSPLISPVPEPSSIAMIAVGLGLAAFRVRRSRRRV